MKNFPSASNLALLSFGAWMWAFAASVTSAGVMSADWLASGDGLLTYDDVNHREWLDLSQTVGQSYADVVSKLGLGQQFEGFSTASSSDFLALVQSAGIDPNTTSFSTNYGPASAFMDLVSVTTTNSFDNTSASRGWLTGGIPTGNVYYTLGSTRFPATRAGAFIDPGSSPSPDIGTWLFRDAATPAVPEPSSIVLLMSGGCGIVGCIARRKRNAKKSRLNG